jgi:hypothetical protein
MKLEPVSDHDLHGHLLSTRSRRMGTVLAAMGRKYGFPTFRHVISGYLSKGHLIGHSKQV